MRLFGLTLGFSLVAALAASCGDDALVPDTCTVIAGTATLAVYVDANASASAKAVCPALAAPVIRWKSSAPAIATVDSGTGAVRGIAAGQTTLTATVVGHPNAAAQIPVVVTVPTCNLLSFISIRLTPPTVTVLVGGRTQLTTDLRFSCGNVPADTTVVYTSGDTTIATVDGSGAVTGKKVGQVTIAAASRAIPGILAFATVTVAPSTAPDVGLVVAPSLLQMIPLDTARITAFVPPLPGETQSRGVTFTSADSCAARVSADGRVVLLQAGTTTITVAVDGMPTVSQRVVVKPFLPSGPDVIFRSFAHGASGDTVDTRAVRDTITVDFALLRIAYPSSGRVELRLAGGLAATVPFPVFTPGVLRTDLKTVVNTTARDSAGARLYPNGPQLFEARIAVDGGDVFPGCAPLPAVEFRGTTLQPLTLVNT